MLHIFSQMTMCFSVYTQDLLLFPGTVSLDRASPNACRTPLTTAGPPCTCNSTQSSPVKLWGPCMEKSSQAMGTTRVDSRRGLRPGHERSGLLDPAPHLGTRG